MDETIESHSEPSSTDPGHSCTLDCRHPLDVGTTSHEAVRKTDLSRGPYLHDGWQGAPNPPTRWDLE